MRILRRRNQADSAERLCGQRLVRIVAEVGGREIDAREADGALPQVVGLLSVYGLLDDYRSRRIAAALLELRDHLPDRHVDDLREAPQLVQPRGPFLRKIGRPELDGRGRAIVHDRPALPVEHRPSRSLERNRAELIVDGRVQVLRPGENLQRPEPEEEHAEDSDRDAAQNRDPQRDLRCQPERLGDTWRRRHERSRTRAVRGRSPSPPRPDLGASQAAAPPRGRSAAGGRAGGRARRPAPSGSS